MTERKKIKTVLTGLIVLLAAIVAGLFLLGDRLVLGVVQQGATASVGREVVIGDISLSLWRGNIGFADITVQNAEGYDSPFAMTLERAYIDTQPSSLFGPTVRVKTIELDGVEIFVEQKALKNNLLDLLAAMPAQQEPEAEEQTEGKNVNVATTTIENITVHLKIGKGGAEPRMLKIKIDPIVLEDLGTEKEINSGAIAARIIAAVAAGVIRQTADELPAEAVNQIIALAKDTVDLDKITLGEGREILESAGEKIFEGVRDILP